MSSVNIFAFRSSNHPESGESFQKNSEKLPDQFDRIEISVFDHEIQDCPDSCEEK
jgi:hypothetical protein